MSTETGLEALIGKIESDAEASLAALRAEGERELASLAAQQASALLEIEQKAQEQMDALTRREMVRGQSAAQAAARAVFAEKKSALVREAFSLAVRKISSMDERAYLSLMAPMLSAAAGEFPQDAALTLVVPETAPASGETLVQAAGVRVGLIRTSKGMASGFLLCSDTLEVDCTPEKLAADRYERLSSQVAAILFGKEA